MGMTSAEQKAFERLMERLEVDPREEIPTSITPDEIAESAEVLGSSLRLYLPEAWRLIDPAKFVPNWHIDAICEHLEAVSAGDILDLLISVGPRHSKTATVCVIWPTWEFQQQPWQQWLFSSYSYGLSLEASVKRRRIIESTWYQQRFGKRVKLMPDQNTKARYHNDRKGYMMSVSTESAVTGEGGTRLVSDDPNDVKKRESEVISRQTLDWFNVTWSTRRNSPQSARVVIQQRTRENDVTGDCLEKGGWTHLCLPTEFDPKRRCFTSWTVKKTGEERKWSDPRTYEGELLNPQRFGPDKVEGAKLELGDFQYNAQHQQNPTPPEGTIIKAQWLQYYGGPSDTPLPDFSKMIGMLTPLLSVDCAFKDNKDSDYVCGLVWAQMGADIYLLPRHFHDRLSFTGTVDAITEMVGGKSVDGQTDFPGIYPFIKVKLIEDKANGPAIINTIQHRVPGVIPFDPGTASKTSRLEAGSWRFRARNIYLPHADIAPWIKDYVWELCAFPKAKRDDYVDATSQFLLFIGGDPTVTGFPEGSTQRSKWGIEQFSVDEEQSYGTGGTFGNVNTQSSGGHSRWRTAVTHGPRQKD
jgi:predicted phage terminase large subunit-like protein